jgi:hypothetical protein
MQMKCNATPNPVSLTVHMPPCASSNQILAPCHKRWTFLMKICRNQENCGIVKMRSVNGRYEICKTSQETARIVRTFEAKHFTKE